jgi:putative FmdB family regulatory protein
VPAPIVKKEEATLPTYQYSCTDCGHFFEQFQSFSEESLSVCPACEGRLRKVFNAVGVVFKGSGFYRTDSRASTGAGEAAGKDGKDSKNGKEAAPKPAEKASTTGTTATSTASSTSSAA